MAALWDRNRAQGNSDKQRSMVVESKAYTVLSRSKPSGSLALQGSGDADQYLSEVGEDAPVVRLVGGGQGGA